MLYKWQLYHSMPHEPTVRRPHLEPRRQGSYGGQNSGGGWYVNYEDTLVYYSILLGVNSTTNDFGGIPFGKKLR